MRKVTIIFGLIAIMISAALLFSGCAKKDENKQASETPDAGMPKAPQFHGKIAGITWGFPNTWTVAPEKAMRAATYIVNPVGDDSDSAECAVFYFGPASGGGTDENIKRWAGQFGQPDGSESIDKASISESEISGLKITTIDLKGTYMVAAGPMMQVSTQKEGYHLLGAIVEGPEGSVFFKMTGPENTMAASESDFTEMIGSLEPLPE
ncbi:MAG: hypothetical protein V3W18_01365 [candidate division Zixibacteria bacterium]